MHFDTIVIGIGGSEHSTAAARWVTRHFSPDARITLVRCLREERRPSFLTRVFGGGSDAPNPTVEEEERALRGLASELDGDRIEVEVRAGDPAEALPRAASDLGADLVCIGAPRERDFPDLRGTTERLLHEIHRPVLVVRQPPPGRPRVVLAAVDESALTLPVLRAARDAADAFGSELRAFHVIRSQFLTPARQVSSEQKLEGLDERALAAGEEWLEARMREAGWESPSGAGTVSVGSASADDIRKRATEEDAELLVVGSRGAGGLGRIVIGSVARSLLHDAPCPVLLVRADGEAGS